MDIYAIIATVSLVMQVSVLIVLLSGFILKVRKKFRQHGIVMLLAVGLHAITIFVVMIPSFIIAFIPEFIVKNPEKNISILAVVHGTAGLTAFLLGIWLVASWRLKAEMGKCFARKKIMRTTIALWITALVLGISIYLYLYMPPLFG
jgi:uncharacterized membrane protein YozB (DUF420 family)